jgi:DHA1 family tetracycline resistance protein-like MFS transporter
MRRLWHHTVHGKRPWFLMAAHASHPRSSLTIIFVTVFVDLLGFGIVLPLLPYYAHQFSASGFTAGALVAVYSAMQFLCAPLWGRWSDRVGRRPIILLSLAGSTVSYLLFALADGIGLLFVSRILAGVAGANIPVAQAFIADSTTEKDRARGMGLIGAAFGLGFVFGPVVGGLLAHYGHWAPGLAATVICGVNFLVAIWRLPESLAPEHRHATPVSHPLAEFRVVLRRPRMARMIFLFAAGIFSFSTMETTLSLLCATVFGMSASHIYWAFGYMGVMMTLMQGGLIGRLTHQVDEARLVVVGAALLAIGLGAAPFSPPVFPLLVTLGAIAFGQGINSPVLSSLISKSSHGRQRGEVLGVSQAMGSLARILGPLWGGLLFDHAGPAGPYVTTAALMLIATGVAWALPHGGAAVAEVETEAQAGV